MATQKSLCYICLDFQLQMKPVCPPVCTLSHLFAVIQGLSQGCIILHQITRGHIYAGIQYIGWCRSKLQSGDLVTRDKEDLMSPSQVQQDVKDGLQ